jgi:hypothetical protein
MDVAGLCSLCLSADLDTESLLEFSEGLSWITSGFLTVLCPLMQLFALSFYDNLLDYI